MRRIKKITITISEKDGEWLSLCAQDLGISRPNVVRRMVREGLREYRNRRGGSFEPENQLDLFESFQVDIFDNISEAEEPQNN